MPRIKLSPELKEAISDLSHKEKDKLIFRMLPSKKDLVNQLIFKLLEDGNTTEIRRQALIQTLEDKVEFAISSYYSPGYFLLDLRECSGMINQHVKITRDKYGELQASFMVLLRSISALKLPLSQASWNRMNSLAPYVIKRCVRLMKLLAKMHEDVHFDFKEDVQALGQLLADIPQFEFHATELGLDLGDMTDMDLTAFK